MSRIGKKPIAIPKGVTVKVDGNTVDVKGPRASCVSRCRRASTLPSKTASW